jgi:hypothetical protein
LHVIPQLRVVLVRPRALCQAAIATKGGQNDAKA